MGGIPMTGQLILGQSLKLADNPDDSLTETLTLFCAADAPVCHASCVDETALLSCQIRLISNYDRDVVREIPPNYMLCQVFT
jgi:hypothetical protein